MIDICLKFKDKQTADSLLSIYLGNIDVIGVIYKPTGDILIGEDGEYPEMTPIDGWHVNLRGEFSDWILAAFKAYMVEPKNPARVWA